MHTDCRPLSRCHVTPHPPTIPCPAHAPLYPGHLCHAFTQPFALVWQSAGGAIDLRRGPRVILSCTLHSNHDMYDDDSHGSTRTGPRTHALAHAPTHEHTRPFAQESLSPNQKFDLDLKKYNISFAQNFSESINNIDSYNKCRVHISTPSYHSMHPPHRLLPFLTQLVHPPHRSQHFLTQPLLAHSAISSVNVMWLLAFLPTAAHVDVRVSGVAVSAALSNTC
jgi:hypothetical protein